MVLIELIFKEFLLFWEDVVVLKELIFKNL